MRKMALMMAVAFLAAGCVSPDGADGPDENVPGDGEAPLTENVPLPTDLEWVQLPDLSLPRAEHWACNFDHRIYVIGGFILASPVANEVPTEGVMAGGAPIPTDMVEVYDAKSNEVTAGPEYPVTLDHAPCIGYNGAIFVFNGGDSYKIEPDGANEWVRFTPSPNGHSAGDVGLWGDKIILTGGSNPTVDIYDPATDSWTTGEAEMPTDRGHTSGDVVLGKFYMAGGDTGGHSVNTEANEEYDPVTDSWTVKAPLPVVRGSTQAVVWFDRLVVMGGQSGASGTPAYDNVNVYDPVTDNWTEIDPMPAGRHGFGAAVWDDNIYVFAGAPKQDIYGFAENHALMVGGSE